MRACTAGKRTFKHEADAQRELKRMKKRVIDPFRLQVYRCEQHKGWHIGNAPFNVRPDEVTRKSDVASERK